MAYRRDHPGLVATNLASHHAMTSGSVTSQPPAAVTQAMARPLPVVPYGPLLVIILVPALWSVVIAGRALVLYWRETHGPVRDLWAPCAAVFYGFLGCTLSTASAAIMQDLLDSGPPYPYLSVPVMSGIMGGVAMVIGCTGLTVLKRRSDPAPTDARMAGHDMGFLTALNALAATGILVLLTRTSAIFPALLIVHLATIVVCFGIFPYTKFMYFTYRFLAVVKDNLERRA